MSRKIIIVSPPRFKGRPEQDIFHAVVKQLSSLCIAADLLYEVEEGDSIILGRESVPEGVVYPPDRFINFVTDMNIRLIDKMEKGNVYFFVEGWWPGIDQLFYYNKINKLDNRFVGLFHSCSSVPGDFARKWDWAKITELAWCLEYKKIVVATRYIKNKILESLRDSAFFNTVSEKFKVTGLPIPIQLKKSGGIGTKWPFEPNEEGKYVVIFNHRPSDDKGFRDFIDMAINDCSGSFKYKFLSPTPVGDIPSCVELVVCRRKSEYYEELGKGHFVISFATLETFGYSVLEGVLLGLCPVLPNVASYPEMYPEIVLYDVDSFRRDLWGEALSQLNVLLGYCRCRQIEFPSLEKYIQGEKKIVEVLIKEALDE